MAQEDLEYDSHEQSERARAWFQRNSSSLIVGVLTAVSLIWGYQAWQGGKLREQERASLAYETLVTAIRDKDDANIGKLAAQLRNDFSKSTYAAVGSLAEAGYLLEQGKPEIALSALKFAESQGASVEVQNIASMRLARVLLSKGDATGALAAISKIPGEGFAAALQELKGDIYAQQGKREDAFKAYDAALTASDLAAPGRSTLQMKRDNLSGPSS